MRTRTCHLKVYRPEDRLQVLRHYEHQRVHHQVLHLEHGQLQQVLHPEGHRAHQQVPYQVPLHQAFLQVHRLAVLQVFRPVPLQVLRRVPHLGQSECW